MKVGVVGTGYWGTKIYNKLVLSHSVIFFSKDPQFYYPLIPSVDWIFVASPDDTHFEIVKYCLSTGVSVFCEKPVSRDFGECLEIYEMSKSSQGYLYVDDVFEYGNPRLVFRKSNSVIWKKSSHRKFESRRELLFRLAFHDFYLLWPSLVDKPIKRVELLPDLNILQFSIIYQSGLSVDFLYDVCSQVPQHTINGVEINSGPETDALNIMLERVLVGKVDFEKNHARTLFASWMIKEILNEC